MDLTGFPDSNPFCSSDSGEMGYGMTAISIQVIGYSEVRCALADQGDFRAFQYDLRIISIELINLTSHSICLSSKHISKRSHLHRLRSQDELLRSVNRMVQQSIMLYFSPKGMITVEIHADLITTLQSVMVTIVWNPTDFFRDAIGMKD
jgi:hypothetical protein